MFSHTINIKLVGISPLMFSRITEAAMEQMRTKSRSSIKVKEDRDPRDVAKDLLFEDEKGIYLPKAYIRAAVIQAGVFTKAGKKQLTNSETSIIPAGLKIVTEKCYLYNPDPKKKLAWEVDMRPITLASGGKDVAVRPRIDVWAADVEAMIDPEIISEGVARLLFDDAGLKVGVGVFRVERKGDYGQFRIDEWKVIKDIKEVPKKKAA